MSLEPHDQAFARFAATGRPRELAAVFDATAAELRKVAVYLTRTADEADTAERRIPFAYALSRYLIGDAYADALGYPKSPWARVFPVFRRLNIEAGGRLRSFAPVERMAVQAGRRYWRDVTQMALRGVPAGFSMPEAPR